MPKNPIFYLVRSIACLVLIETLWKLADNRDRHKILDEFEFRPDQTIYFGVTCPLVPINAIFGLVQSVACFWLKGAAWTGMKSGTSSNSAKIRIFTLVLLALECQKPNIIFYIVQSIISLLIFIQFLWNLQINRTGIKYWTSLKLDHIALFTWSYMPWIAGWVSGEWSLPYGLIVFSWSSWWADSPPGHVHCYLSVNCIKISI